MKRVVALAIVLLLIVAVLIASIIVIQYVSGTNWYNYTPNVKSQELEREALAFTKSIIQLDYTKYYGQIGDLPNQFNPYTFQYYINYQNSSNLSAYEKYQQMLTLSYLDVNHTEISFTISTIDGLISYNSDRDSVVNQTEGFLERYQTAYNASYTQALINSLDSYSTITNSSQQIGDFHLDMHSAYGTETITWSRAVNDIPNTFDTLSITFKDGIFNSFDDKWDSFAIGSATVNISQEKALQIADQKVQSVQTVPWDGGLVGISGATIDANSVTSSLSFQPNGNVTYGEPGTLCPCWQLYGNITYPSGTPVSNPYFDAVIRADTGQIQELRLGSYSVPT